MNKNTSLIFNAIAVLGGVAYAIGASAQSSVTLYGIAEDAVIYTSSSAALGSNSGGKSVIRMVNGNWAGSRFGLKGAEDLGGGNSAIFNLEAGFNLNTGDQQYAGLLFSRQSWVGFKSNSYGAVTAGRQYPTYTTFLAPISSLVYLSAFGAHPSDIDSMDTIYRANNSVSYVSPSINGFTFGATACRNCRQHVPGFDVERGSQLSERAGKSRTRFLEDQQCRRRGRSMECEFDDLLVRAVRCRRSRCVGANERISDRAEPATVWRSRGVYVLLGVRRAAFVFERSVSTWREFAVQGTRRIQYSWHRSALETGVRAGSCRGLHVHICVKRERRTGCGAIPPVGAGTVLLAVEANRVVCQ